MEELSLAIANRSASFFHLKMFQECLEDIDLAIKLGYPVKSRIKLIVRRSACEAELNRVIKNPEERPTPNVSSGGQLDTVKVLKTDSGRGMFASQKITSGELVLMEKPYVSVLHPNRYKSHCYHCLRPLDKRPTPCRSCRQVRYCSNNCSNKSWTLYHETECCYLDILNVSNDFHYSPKLTLRAILRTGLLNCANVSIAEEADSVEVSNCFSDPVQQYKSFCSLIQHEKEDKNDYSIAIVILVAFLLEKHPDHVVTKKTIVALAERIGHHLRQVNVNGISITCKRVVVDDAKDPMTSSLASGSGCPAKDPMTSSPTSGSGCPANDVSSSALVCPRFEEQTIGCGVYLTARFINHSCDPNTRITTFDGDTLLLHCIKDIESNSEITFSYGGNYRWQIMSERKRMLKNSYFFDCQCEACSARRQPVSNALVCSECSGPVVSDGPMTCQKCGEVDHLNLKSILGDTEACLKMAKLGTTFLDIGIKAMDVVDKNRDASERTDFEAAEKALTEAYNGLKCIMYAGHPELDRINEKLSQVYLKLENYEKVVEISAKIFHNLASTYDLTYYKVFNSLFRLVVYQSLLYSSLKTKKPLDKNRINTLKTDALKNLDLLEENLGKITRENTIFTVKIENLRKLFFN